MASTTQAPSALTDGQTDGQDRAAKLKALVDRVQSRSARVSAPAESLQLEVDGEVIACAKCSEMPRAFALPGDARSLTLLDQAGTPRAHVLLDESLADGLFDNGRLSLELERTSAQTRLIVRTIDS